MKAGRAKIGIFQKMRIKNLRGGQWGLIKEIDSFTLETSKNFLIRNFLRNRRPSVKFEMGFSLSLRTSIPWKSAKSRSLKV